MTMMSVMTGVTGSEMGMRQKPKTEQQQQQQLTLKQKPPTMMTTTTTTSSNSNTGQKTRTKKILQGLIL